MKFVTESYASLSFLDYFLLVLPGLLHPYVRLANSKAGIKPNAPLSVFDKKNSIEFPLNSVYYLYMKSNPNPFFYPMLPDESLSSCVSIDKKIK